jgi:hypothetical protein
LQGVTLSGVACGGPTTVQSVIYYNTSGATNYLNFANDCLVENIEFNGPSAGLALQAAAIVAGVGTVVRNCYFEMRLNASGAKWIDALNNARIENCYFLGVNGWPDKCIEVTSTEGGVSIKDCIFGSISQPVTGHCVNAKNGSYYHGVIDGNRAEMAANDATFVYMNSSNRGFRITNNHVKIATATGSPALSCFLNTNGSTGVDGYHVISGNYIVALQSADYRQLPLIEISQPYCVVSDNTIEASYYGYDDNNELDAVFVLNASSDHSVVSNNSCDLEKCVALYIGVQKTSIIGNTFVGCSCNYFTATRTGAIIMGDGSDDVTYTRIIGNYIEFASVHASATGNNYGIVTRCTSDANTAGSAITANNGVTSEAGSGDDYLINSANMELCTFTGNNAYPCFDGDGSDNEFGTSSSTNPGCNKNAISPP